MTTSPNLWCEVVLLAMLGGCLAYLAKTNKPISVGFDTEGKPLFAKKYRLVLLTLVSAMSMIGLATIIKAIAIAMHQSAFLFSFASLSNSWFVRFFGPLAVIDAVRRADFEGRGSSSIKYFWPIVDGLGIGLFLAIQCSIGSAS